MLLASKLKADTCSALQTLKIQSTNSCDCGFTALFIETVLDSLITVRIIMLQ
jgi:hypothetical protein